MIHAGQHFKLRLVSQDNFPSNGPGFTTTIRLQNVHDCCPFYRCFCNYYLLEDTLTQLLLLFQAGKALLLLALTSSAAAPSWHTLHVQTGVQPSSAFSDSGHSSFRLDDHLILQSCRAPCIYPWPSPTQKYWTLMCYGYIGLHTNSPGRDNLMIR